MGPPNMSAQGMPHGMPQGMPPPHMGPPQNAHAYGMAMPPMHAQYHNPHGYPGWGVPAHGGYGGHEMRDGNGMDNDSVWTQVGVRVCAPCAKKEYTLWMQAKDILSRVSRAVSLISPSPSLSLSRARSLSLSPSLSLPLPLSFFCACLPFSLSLSLPPLPSLYIFLSISLALSSFVYAVVSCLYMQPCLESM